jgi:Pyruvate/2-oxoacid:ferredoxin oxidoreductase gamma subunit
VSINRYNEKSRQKRVPSALTDSLSDLEDFMPDRSFESEESAIHLGKIISDYVRSLSKRQRYIFMSRYYTAEPIEKIARELGNSKVLNSVVLGLAAKYIGFSEDEWLEVLKSTVPQKTVDINTAAFKAGYNS